MRGPHERRAREDPRAEPEYPLNIIKNIYFQSLATASGFFITFVEVIHAFNSNVAKIRLWFL